MLKFLISFFMLLWFECCPFNNMCFIFNTKYQISEVLILNSCTICKDRNSLANFLFRMKIQLKLDPFAFMRLFYETIDQFLSCNSFMIYKAKDFTGID